MISADNPTNDFFLKFYARLELGFVIDWEIKVIKTEILFPFKSN